MKKERGQEASYCYNMVSDRGDRCLSTFNVALAKYFRFLFVKPK
jgi:hypothetical protein